MELCKASAEKEENWRLGCLCLCLTGQDHRAFVGGDDVRRLWLCIGCVWRFLGTPPCLPAQDPDECKIL